MPRGQAASGTQHQLRDDRANSSFTICTSYRQMGHFTVPGMLFQWSSCHLEAVQDLLFQDVLSGNPKPLPSLCSLCWGGDGQLELCHGLVYLGFGDRGGSW